jgi:hypothetical protein
MLAKGDAAIEEPPDSDRLAILTRGEASFLALLRHSIGPDNIAHCHQA